MGPKEKNDTYEFVLTTPTVSSMSCSSDMDGFRDKKKVAVELMICGMLIPGIHAV